MLGNQSRLRPVGVAALAAILSILPATACLALEFPGTKPGQAQAKVTDTELILENAAIALKWTITHGHFKPVSVTNKLTNKTIDFTRGDSECFELILEGRKRLRASEMTLVGKPVVKTLEAEPDCVNLARKSSGKQIVVRLASPDGNLQAEWRAVLRDGSNYVRPTLILTADRTPVLVERLVLIDLAVASGPEARVVGKVPGSPVAMAGFFFAYEHANSENAVEMGEKTQRICCSLKRNAPVKPGEETVQTSAIGVVPDGQLRRGFLYYVERERAHPYRPALHYNSWYDVSWPGHRMDEANCLAVIECFGRELTEKRGVKLQCFLWDDGWDDNTTLWQIDKNRFPRGFVPLLAAARRYGSNNGVWMSPFGGYEGANEERIAHAKREGFELLASNRFSMAGPKYFQRFLEISLYWIKENGCVHFKYDGINTSVIEENDAMFRLVAELRKARPDLFVNLTIGTWPSPFYLWLGDSTSRGGLDMGLEGKGSVRQKWINYRDLQTYRGIVQAGPLYPINSLCLQGIVQSHYGTAGILGNAKGEFRDEVRSFFVSGTATQELYIRPQKLTERNWDDLAEGAEWSQANADVLVDTHWIGGDPAKHEVYGWASWCPRKGILALRNPNDQPGKITIDIGKAFE